MTTPFSLTFLNVLRSFHDQLAPRVRAMQDAIQHQHAETASYAQLEREVERLTIAVTHLQDMAEQAGDQALTRLLDALAYAGNEAGMGAPFKGFSALDEVQTFLHAAEMAEQG
jgi:hypothetical protein